MIQIKLNDSNLFLINPYKNISNFQLIKYIPIQLIFSIISKLTPYNPIAKLHQTKSYYLCIYFIYLFVYCWFIINGKYILSWYFK